MHLLGVCWFTVIIGSESLTNYSRDFDSPIINVADGIKQEFLSGEALKNTKRNDGMLADSTVIKNSPQYWRFSSD